MVSHHWNNLIVVTVCGLGVRPAINSVLSQLTETLRVNEGGSVTFECPYTNATSITWLKDGVVVEMENTSTLTLAEVDRTLHNTSYSCVATTPTNTTERMNFQLLVNYFDPGVTVTVQVDPCSGDTIYAGSMVTLTCGLPPAYPAPRVVAWLLNDEPVAASGNIMFSNDMLTFTSVSADQTGLWVCRAENDAGMRSSQPTLINVQVLVQRSAAINPSDSTQLIKLNGRKELRCSFDPPLFGNEKNGVHWTVDGGGVRSGSEGYSITALQCSILLSIEPVIASNEGTYRCHHNDLRLTSEPVELVIANIRSTYTLTLSPFSPIGAGQQVTLACTPEGPAGNVMESFKWRFTSNLTGDTDVIRSGGRVSIHSSGQRLVISDLQVDDSGVWSCVAFNELTEDVVNSKELVVEASPRTVVQPSSRVVRVGTSLTLTCHVDSQRDIAFAWVVGGATYNQSTGRFVISSTPTQSTLTLVTVEEGDLGNVTCVARDPIHLPISTNSLLTEDPAFYLYGNSDNRNFTLVDSDVFRLDCGVRGGGSDVKVHWFRNLLEVGSSGSEGFEIRTLPNGTSSLIRSMASLADDGNAYSCKAVYNRVSLTQRFNIFVTIPGKFTQLLPAITNATQGHFFKIDCMVTGRPQPVVEWLYKGMSVKTLNTSLRSVEDLGNGSLVFRPVDSSHAGVYSCVIDEPPPSFKHMSTMLKVQNGSPIELSPDDIILICVTVVAAVIILLVSAVLAVFCTARCYRKRSKTSGHYVVHQESLKAFERQPSLRDRKDNSGILSSSPSHDIFNALQKSPEAVSDMFQYPGTQMYPTTIQLDMYGGGGSSMEKHPPTSYNSTPLHGTVASTSVFSSDDPSAVTLPNYPRNNLELGDVMGEGEFGPVVLGVANHILPTQDKTLVAVKVLVTREDDEEARPDLVLMDFANQMKLTYTHIASILGICSDREPYYVIYEYLDQGDLKKFLQHSQPEEGDPPALTPADMRRIILQVADGMAYLFSQRIIHGDLASRNCLVSSTLEIKIADLGIGHDLYNNDYYDNGSQLLPIRWMPPELLQQMSDGPSFSLHSDIWSFGVFCWEVFSYAKLPYENFEDNEILTIVPSGSRLRRPGPACPHTLYDLMLECWSEVPDRRPQFARLCVAIADLDFSEPQFSQ